MPLTVNCTCGKVFRVKDEMAGQVVTCQVCGNMLTAEVKTAAPVETRPPHYQYDQYEAHAPAPLEPPRQQAMKQCPGCGENIPQGARVCPHCGERYSATLSAEDQAELLEKTVAAVETHAKDLQSQIADDTIKGGLLSGRTIVAILILGASAASVLHGAATYGNEPFIVLGIIVGLITLICAIVSLYNDHKASHIVDAPSAMAACENFLLAVRTSRTNKAFVALSPTARKAERVETIKFREPGIPIHTGHFSITDPRSFKKYWESIFTGPSLQSRLVQASVSGARKLSDDMVLVNLEFKVTNYPKLLLFTIILGVLVAVIIIYAVQKKETVSVRKLMIRREGRWYFAEGALMGPLDAVTV